MDRWQRERVDEYVRDFRTILAEHPKYEKFVHSARIDTECAAMLLGVHRDSAAFKNIVRKCWIDPRGPGRGTRTMYSLQDVAKAVVEFEEMGEL